MSRFSILGIESGMVFEDIEVAEVGELRESRFIMSAIIDIKQLTYSHLPLLTAISSTTCWNLRTCPRLVRPMRILSIPAI